YNRSPRITSGERSDFLVDLSSLYQYFDQVYRNSVSVGALYNLAWKSARSKIQLNNTFSTTAEDQLLNRQGHDNDLASQIQAYSLYYRSNRLFISQLIGEHALTERQIKLNWGISYNRSNREVPSYRRMIYSKSDDAEANAPFYASVPSGSPSPNFAGNFYSVQDESSLNGRLDVTVPYFISSQKGSFKAGGLVEGKERDFDARLFGFVSGNQTPQELFTLPIATIFAPKNIGDQGFRMRESPDLSDSYDASSMLGAGYAMLEQSFSNRLRFIGGVRAESFQQELNSFKVLRPDEPVNIDTTYLDVLPSAHFIFALSDSANLRLAVAKTVIRPNFRELAPLAFFDFELFAGVEGNPALKRTQVWNADLRFETYRRGAQYFAVSLFYKKFNHPIEQVRLAGTKAYKWENVPSAIDLGAEVEGRLKLTRLAGFLRDFMVFGNVSYIYSDVDVSQTSDKLERPLFGQSPFLVNAGLNYSNPELGFTSTVLFNRIGRRVWLVGYDQYLHTWEAPRS
ncbi:MAG: TonB-dependent receptor, partial [Bacteroidota bacterium]